MNTIGKGTVTQPKTSNLAHHPIGSNGSQGLCMIGRIYPTKDGFVVRFGRNISKWFKHEVEAERFLNWSQV